MRIKFSGALERLNRHLNLLDFTQKPQILAPPGMMPHHLKATPAELAARATARRRRREGNPAGSKLWRKACEGKL